MTRVSPIPEGFHAITPHMVIKNAAEAIEFYKKAFGAEEIMRMDAPGGTIGHAEIQIGDSKVMLADEFPEMDAKGPNAFGGTSDTLNITATVNAAGVYLNTSEVTGANEGDSDSTVNNGITTEDDYAEQLTTPTAVADQMLSTAGGNGT